MLRRPPRRIDDELELGRRLEEHLLKEADAATSFLACSQHERSALGASSCVTRVERSSSCVGISEALLAATSLLGRSGEQKGGRNAPTNQGEGAARILTLRRRAWRAVRAAARERSN